MAKERMTMNNFDLQEMYDIADGVNEDDLRVRDRAIEWLREHGYPYPANSAPEPEPSKCCWYFPPEADLRLTAA